MDRTHTSRPRSRTLMPFAAALLLVGFVPLSGSPARADLPTPFELHREIRSGVHDVLRHLVSVPERIHRTHERHLRVFRDGHRYDRRHRHDHAVYRFPVWIDGRVSYRPYAYCGDRLHGYSSSRPRLWVEWGHDRHGSWCGRCHGYYPRGHRHDGYRGRYDRDWHDRYRDGRYDRDDWRYREHRGYDRDRHDRYERGRHGRYDRHPRDSRYGIPPGHLPPPGSCRVWYEGRPPGHQPPPTDCASAHRAARQSGGRVIYGGGR